MIPKKIHQIWIGEVNIPLEWERWRKSIEKAHPNWEYKLWTNDDVDFLISDYPQKIKDYYSEVKNNKRWSWMTDIMRYIILYKFGGMYVDCDTKMRPDKSFDELPLEKDLILTNPLYWDDDAERSRHLIQTCFIASKQGEPFVKRLVQNLRNVSYAKSNAGKNEMYAVSYISTEYYLHIHNIIDYKKTTPIDSKSYLIKGKDYQEFLRKMPTNHLMLPNHYFWPSKGKATLARHFEMKSHWIDNMEKYTKK